MTASVIQPMADDWRADAPRSLRAHLGFGLLVLSYVLIAMAIAATLGGIGRVSVWRSISFIFAMVVVIGVSFFVVRVY